MSFKYSEDKDVIKKKDIYKYHKPENTNVVRKCKVSELDLNIVKPQRAGVIIYTKIDNEIIFGLGVDTLSKEYTDFGGGISYHKDKNVILGALREFKEESLGIFGEVDFNHVLNSYVIYNNNNLIIFYYINLNPTVINDVFLLNYNQTVKDNIVPEVCEIKWMNMTEFKKNIATRGKMFHRVQVFLQQSGELLRMI